MTKFSVARKHVELEGNGTKFLVSREECDLMKDVHFLQGGAQSIEYNHRKYAIGKKFSTLPSVTPRSGTRFVSWQTTVSPIQNVNTNTIVDINTLELSPSLIDLVNITFDCDGGRFPDSTQTKTLQFAPGYQFAEYPFPANPTKTDKNFDGWYPQRSGGGTEITESSICPSVPTTYYANWIDGYGTMVFCGNYNDGYSETDIVLGNIISYDSENRVVMVQCNGSEYIEGFSDEVTFYFNDQNITIGSGYQWEQFDEYSLNWYGVSGFDIYVKMRM